VRARWWRLGLSVAIGAVAAWFTNTLDIPGDGRWIVICWALGVGAALVEASWASLAACVAGIIAMDAVFVIAVWWYTGLAWLIMAAETAVLGYGFLVGAVVQRAWRVRSIVDRRVVTGAAAAVGLLVAFILIAQDFARNPP
jgi:hypothetical protein